MRKLLTGSIGGVFVVLSLSVSVTRASGQEGQLVPISECIEVSITSAPQINSKYFWEWEFELENTCESTLSVVWHQRSGSVPTEWAAWASSTDKDLRSGETYRKKVHWDRANARRRGWSDRPPRPLLAWCVYKGDWGEPNGRDRCYRDNQYPPAKQGRGSSGNWNEIG